MAAAWLSRIQATLGRAVHRQPGQEVIHFLHIGKTGGTAVIHALNQYRYCAPSLGIYRLDPSDEGHPLVVHIHPHSEHLQHVPPGEKLFFFLRDPLSRFVSAFYSRQRQGQPRYHSPWSEGEKDAYACFHTPNQLVGALSSGDPQERERAQQAMRHIEHLRSSYWEWFQDEPTLRSRVADVLLVGFQEQLARDFERLKTKLKLPPAMALPADDVEAHRNPPGLDKTLDPQALANLQEWYREDYRLIDLCRRIFDASVLSK